MRIAMIVGGSGSALLLVRAAERKGSPLFLTVLFAFWVLSSFALLGVAHGFARRWPARSRAWVNFAVMTVVALSLTAYGIAALGPSEPKTAVFVLVAPVCWLITAIAVAIAAVSARRPN